jgi:hypothetical protein
VTNRLELKPHVGWTDLGGEYECILSYGVDCCCWQEAQYVVLIAVGKVLIAIAALASVSVTHLFFAHILFYR